ncbi:hypothetical protein FFLO_06660 [Filobasidium floriforme]|uniref:Transcription elongation regulator 1 n=1 Tax=Filobasidium floriforme TaxID=5210 RepID=A0A8K0JEY5_9TREE|nr:uncharacterized protein HD553DRAFT_312498 [Filobasidium floriforme]KAG7527712.1 hypothetical protein FFLO_06660 [Filobasidium floriforme]KAH8083500.1 hypothetical protein HD553DRAFT_312498 [Filobasidium floriforme]
MDPTSSQSTPNGGLPGPGPIPPPPPPQVMNMNPPLPPNWSEHKAPNGTSYYYNNLTKQSTYTRPLPTGIAPSFPPPSVPQTLNVGVGPSPYSHTQPFGQPFNPHGHLVNPHGLAPQFPAPVLAPGLASTQNKPNTNTNSTEEKNKKKKEKPKQKNPIPGTSWLKVTTNLNNVFYTDPSTKVSSWVIPDEIKDAVEAFEASLKAQAKKEKEEKAEEERARAEERRLADLRERERIRLELEEEKRKGVEVEKRRKREADRERERKRKERDGEGDDDAGEEEQEEGEDGRRAKKMVKLDEQEGDVEMNNTENNGNNDEDDPEARPELDSEDEEAMAIGPIDESDEEAWQRAVAAEIARETKIKDRQKKENKAAKKAREEEALGRVFQLPPPPQAEGQGQDQVRDQIQGQGQGQGLPTGVARVQVDLNPDEGKALFKSLLYEKDISPFAPWETSLPLFINDPRYVLLPSEKLRQEVYEDYCREVARNRRLGKTKPAGTSSSPSTTAGETSGKKDPEREYKSLLRAEVKSTRTIWEDFRRAWRKDRRFFDYGKDDKQREKVFRDHLRELGERKRADAKRAERDFMDLLREHDEIKPDSDWLQVKRGMTSDPRYDAVGSSSLRAELFQRHVKSLGAQAESSRTETPEEVAARKARERKEKAQASLRERQQQVQGEKMRLERDVQKSKLGAGREDGEREFGSLLIQAVREHNASWQETIPQLEKDPRWEHPALTLADKHGMFIAHLQSLAHKRLDALHKLFLAHAPSLDTPFEDVYPEIVNDFAVTRLGLTPEKLQSRYEEWQRVRFQQSKAEFQALLKESSFVDFWGRMKNKALASQGVIPNEDSDEEDDGGDETGGKANLEIMAKQIDLKEMHDVLQHDKRYLVFDHVPEEREAWLREYLAGLDNALANLHVQAQHSA